jgi:hypothetical protein
MKIMLNDEQLALLEQRLPDRCPFCYDIDGVSWDEFGINLGKSLWISKGQTEAGYRDEFIQIFCSRCNEEIRQEDVHKEVL